MSKSKQIKPKITEKPNGKGWTIHIPPQTTPTRNEFHFQHQLKTRMQIVESKKYKKPRYKKDYTQDDYD